MNPQLLSLKTNTQPFSKTGQTGKIFLISNKIFIIPSPFFENCFIADFKEKAKLFNYLFSKQYSLIPYNNPLHAGVNFITDKSICLVSFSAKDIGKIIQNPDSNGAHRHDNINIVKNLTKKYVVILFVYH